MKNMEENKANIERNYVQSMKQLFYVLELNRDMIEGREEREIVARAQSSENIINSFDVIIREDAITSIARYQPAAKNVRFFVMMIDSSRLLERMGDLLKACLRLIESMLKKDETIRVLLREYTLLLLGKIEEIYGMYMEAFFHENCELAYQILEEDDKIDSFILELQQKVIQWIQESKGEVEALFLFWNLHKKYERFTDHIIHLSINVIYLVKGENLRRKELEKENRE